MVDETRNTTVNHALRQVRKRSGVSLEKAADHLGITTASMSRLETGLAAVTADRVVSLARFYGVTVADLFEGRLVTMPSDVDLDRLQAVVLLVQSVILKLKVKSSPEKTADVVRMVYRREVEFLIDNPDAGRVFDENRHKKFVTTIFRK